MCAEKPREDDACEWLVERLRGLEGDVFQETASFLEGYKGNVILRPDWAGNTGSYSDKWIQLGTGVAMTQLGPVQAGEGDLYVLAVHEALGHGKHGIGGEYGPETQAMVNFERLLGLELRAFKQLGSLNYHAPLSYLRLKEFGKPVHFYRPLPPR